MSKFDSFVKSLITQDTPSKKKGIKKMFEDTPKTVETKKEKVMSNFPSPDHMNCHKPTFQKVVKKEQ